MKFEEGDLVECLNSEGNRHLESGKVYRVATGGNSTIYLEGFDKNRSFLSHRFRLVTLPTEMNEDAYNSILEAQEVYAKLNGG